MHRPGPSWGCAISIGSAVLALSAGLDGEDIGHEFKDVKLGRHVQAQHPGSDEGEQAEGSLPDLESLTRLLRSGRMEPVVFLELFRDEDDRFAPLWSPDGRRVAFIRADLERKTSKIDLLWDLASARTRALFSDTDSYDYMPAWTRGGSCDSGDFCFASTAGPEQTMEIYFAGPGRDPRRLTAGKQLKKHPDVLMAKDGTLRLVFEKEGQVLWGVIRTDGTLADTRTLGDGAFPEWSPDGSQIAYVQARASESGTSYALVAARPSDSQTEILVAPQPQPLRSPAWSPDGKWVAFYIAAERKGQYDLAVAPTDRSAPMRSLSRDVVVESNFDHVGPAWASNSRGLFLFGRDGQNGLKTVEESYYRLLYRSVGQAGRLVALDYDRRYTTAIAPHVNPVYPEVAFAATRGLSQGLYVLLLNHLEEESEAGR